MTITEAAEKYEVDAATVWGWITDSRAGRRRPNVPVLVTDGHDEQGRWIVREGQERAGES